MSLARKGWRVTDTEAAGLSGLRTPQQFQMQGGSSSKCPQPRSLAKLLTAGIRNRPAWHLLTLGTSNNAGQKSPQEYVLP